MKGSDLLVLEKEGDQNLFAVAVDPFKFSLTWKYLLQKAKGWSDQEH
jgi:hypothetical protein